MEQVLFGFNFTIGAIAAVTLLAVAVAVSGAIVNRL